MTLWGNVSILSYAWQYETAFDARVKQTYKIRSSFRNACNRACYLQLLEAEVRTTRSGSDVTVAVDTGSRPWRRTPEPDVATTHDIVLPG